MAPAPPAEFGCHSRPAAAPVPALLGSETEKLHIKGRRVDLEHMCADDAVPGLVYWVEPHPGGL